MDRYNYYICYALIKTAIDINQLRVENGLPVIYSWDDIVGITGNLSSMTTGIQKKRISLLSLQAEFFTAFGFNSSYKRAYKMISDSSLPLADAYYFLGQVYVGANDFEYAIKRFVQTIEIFPTNYKAWYKLAFCFKQANNIKNARLAYSVVINILEEGYKNNALSIIQTLFFCNSIISVGDIWYKQKKDSVALEYYGRAKEVLERLKNYIKGFDVGINNNDVIKSLGQTDMVKRLEKRLELLDGTV